MGKHVVLFRRLPYGATRSAPIFPPEHEASFPALSEHFADADTFVGPAFRAR